jgi:hypothetical protein
MQASLFSCRARRKPVMPIAESSRRIATGNGLSGRAKSDCEMSNCAILKGASGEIRRTSRYSIDPSIAALPHEWSLKSQESVIAASTGRE